MVLYIPSGWEWDFWTINSITGKGDNPKCIKAVELLWFFVSFFQICGWRGRESYVQSNFSGAVNLRVGSLNFREQRWRKTKNHGLRKRNYGIISSCLLTQNLPWYVEGTHLLRDHHHDLDLMDIHLFLTWICADLEGWTFFFEVCGCLRIQPMKQPFLGKSLASSRFSPSLAPSNLVGFLVHM